jgi:hypothetical protein
MGFHGALQPGVLVVADDGASPFFTGHGSGDGRLGQSEFAV